jgi:hypothetical protein
MGPTQMTDGGWHNSSAETSPELYYGCFGWPKKKRPIPLAGFVPEITIDFSQSKKWELAIFLC